MRTWISASGFVLLSVMALYAAEGTNGVTLPPGDGPSQPVGLTDLWGIFKFIVVFGGFGGLLAAFGESSFKDIMKDGFKAYGKFGHLIICLLIGSLLGIGGASGVTWVAMLDGKFTDLDNIRDVSIFALTCILGGFSGLQILIILRKRLTKDMEDKMDKKADDIRHDIEKDIRNEAAKYADAVSSATGALSLKKPVRMSDAIKKIEAIIEDYSTDRALNIFLGRLFRALGNLDSAIAALSRALETRENKAGLKKNHDDGALLYNRACYYNLQAEELDTAGNPKAAEKKRVLAWDDLKEAVLLDSDNKSEAEKDPDLVSLFKPGSRELNSL